MSQGTEDSYSGAQGEAEDPTIGSEFHNTVFKHSLPFSPQDPPVSCKHLSLVIFRCLATTDPADVYDFEVVFETHGQPVLAVLFLVGHLLLANDEGTVRTTDGSSFVEATPAFSHPSKQAVTTSLWDYSQNALRLLGVQTLPNTVNKTKLAFGHLRVLCYECIKHACKMKTYPLRMHAILSKRSFFQIVRQ